MKTFNYKIRLKLDGKVIWKAFHIEANSLREAKQKLAKQNKAFGKQHKIPPPFDMKSFTLTSVKEVPNA